MLGKTDNSPAKVAHGMTADNPHISQEFIEAVLNGHVLADVSMLAFRDPASFIAGSIHIQFFAWEQQISKVAPYGFTPKVLRRFTRPFRFLPLLIFISIFLILLLHTIQRNVLWRILSLGDAKLLPSAWSKVQAKLEGQFGHSAD